MPDNQPRGKLTLKDLKDQGLLDAIVETFGEAGPAKELLDEVGFPRGRRPVFGTPLYFWRDVCTEIENGMTRGGLAVLLAKAAALRPEEERFATWALPVDAPTPPTPSARGPVKLLFLAASPVDADQVRFGPEWEDIQKSIAAPNLAVPIHAVARLSVRPTALLDAVTEEKPSILHFSGHCEGDGRMALENARGQVVHFPAEHLCRVIRAVRPLSPVRLICLNACCTSRAANLLVPEVECVVGSPYRVPDDLAVVFSRRFYFSLARGLPVSGALDLGLLDVEQYCNEHPEITDYVRGLKDGNRRVQLRELIRTWHRPGVNPDIMSLGSPGSGSRA